MKIEQYNQRLLAVLGTVGALFLIFAFFAFILLTIMESGIFRDNNSNSGILSDEKIEELQQENKREQVISYEHPQLIDTSNSIYIIPVSHKTLYKKEDINENFNLNKAPANYDDVESGRRYSKRFYGTFNNLIVYDSNTGTHKKLFSHRVNFSEIETEYLNDDILLIMNVSVKDTYKDGVINIWDFKTLYVYSLTSKELKKIGIDGMDVCSYEFLNNEKNLVVRFGVDKNENGRYDEENEPTLIKKYEFSSGKLTDIVGKQIEAEMQKTLEGTKK